MADLLQAIEQIRQICETPDLYPSEQVDQISDIVTNLLEQERGGNG